MFAKTLHCPDCQWRTTIGAAEAAARLRLVGLLRRDTDPDEQIVAELLPGAAENMTCPSCKRRRLLVGEADADGAEQWQAAVLCEICRKPIPPERLEVAPDARRCVVCQSKAETGDLPEEPDFCPKCGALVELRVSRGGGITRYKRFCTGDCRLYSAGGP